MGNFRRWYNGIPHQRLAKLKEAALKDADMTVRAMKVAAHAESDVAHMRARSLSILVSRPAMAAQRDKRAAAQSKAQHAEMTAGAGEAVAVTKHSRDEHDAVTWIRSVLPNRKVHIQVPGLEWTPRCWTKSGRTLEEPRESGIGMSGIVAVGIPICDRCCALMSPGARASLEAVLDASG